MLDAGYVSSGGAAFAGQAQRMATATAMAECAVLAVRNPEWLRQLRCQPAFADRFLTHMLTRNTRIEARSASMSSSTRAKSGSRVRSLLLAQRSGWNPA